jgi:hypothetical protein
LGSRSAPPKTHAGRKLIKTNCASIRTRRAGQCNSTFA